uniref:Uncharacterized protein n=1 Tax=Rhizophora mucronata TaxID=61149 RepID=A0A2P2R545_RHIMU
MFLFPEVAMAKRKEL